jgi:vitamin B12 transporter
MFKQTLSVALSATLVASLGAKELVLDPIVVTATKTEQSLKNITANVDVITSDEIEEKHITTISEALNLVAGISTVSNGGLGKSTSVFLRGFDSKRVLVLIDGVRYNDISDSINGASFENLMVNEIEQIEVIKGAQSGIWGSEASAGVINIITKKAKTGTTLNAHLDYGSFNTKKYGASISHKTDKFDIQAGVNKLTTDGFTAYARRYTDIRNYENDGYRNRTANIKAGYHIDEANTLSLAHTDIDVYNEYDISSTNSSGSYTKKEKLSQIAYENKTGIALTKLHVNRSTFERDYSTGSKFYGRENEYGLSSEIPYAKDDFILVGGDYKSFEHLNALNKTFTGKALFTTNSNVFNDRLVLTESLRNDHYDTFNDKTTGKIGIKYNFDSKTFLSSNYGTGYNVPTPYQLFDGIYGNNGLKPEDTRGYDLSFGYDGLKITYFNNHVKEMIDYDFTTSKYNNIAGISALKGVEAGYKKEILDNTLFSLNYTRLSAKNQRGEDLRRRAKDNVKFGIDYYGFDKLHMGLYGEYVGTRYDSDNNLGEQTGRYTIANFVTNYDLSKNVKLYGKIDNITDKYYQTINNYATSPRAYYGGITVSF